jgi:tRNA uridine 5-carbamoylmethylation protein Kti12
MPLIVLCGVPNSGKSTTAKKLYEYFKQNDLPFSGEIHIVSDQSLKIPKSSSTLNTFFKLVTLVGR